MFFYSVDVGPFFFLGAGTVGCSMESLASFSVGWTTIFTSRNTPYMLIISPVNNNNSCMTNGNLMRIDMRIIIEPLPQIRAALVNELKESKPPITSTF